jgi:hypothetical protein
MLSSKVTIAEMIDRCQDGRHRHVENLSACYKMGNYHRTLMKISTQTKTDTLSSKVIKVEAYGKKQQKLNVKNGIVLKKQRCMSAKLQRSKNFYPPAEASILIQHVVRQSQFECLTVDNKMNNFLTFSHKS